MIYLKRLSLKELTALVAAEGPSVYPKVLAALKGDPRGGAQRLVRRIEATIAAADQAAATAEGLLGLERQIYAMGYRRIAGVASTGRGPLAGPVVAAAVWLPAGATLPPWPKGRRLSRRQQIASYDQILATAEGFGVGLVQPAGGDEPSLLAAIAEASRQAIDQLPAVPDFLLIDGLPLAGVKQGQRVAPAGESLSALAARLIAKETRDRYMEELDQHYPQYGFAQHKGFGTPAHRAALARYGPCPVHRGAAVAAGRRHG